MKWYDYIGMLGVVMLVFAIQQSLSLKMYTEMYLVAYKESYTLSSSEIEYLITLYLIGIFPLLIGLGFNIKNQKRDK